MKFVVTMKVKSNNNANIEWQSDQLFLSLHDDKSIWLNPKRLQITSPYQLDQTQIQSCRLFNHFQSNLPTHTKRIRRLIIFLNNKLLFLYCVVCVRKIWERAERKKQRIDKREKGKITRQEFFLLWLLLFSSLSVSLLFSFEKNLEEGKATKISESRYVVRVA